MMKFELEITEYTPSSTLFALRNLLEDMARHKEKSEDKGNAHNPVQEEPDALPTFIDQMVANTNSQILAINKVTTTPLDFKEDTTSLLLDSTGQFWDERIHSESKIQLKNGTWKLKRGVTEEQVKDSKTSELENTAEEVIAQLVFPAAQPPPSLPQVPMSYVQLIDKIKTAMLTNEFDHAAVNEVLTKLGVQSLPLLGARLDLIPQVALMLNLK